MSGLDIHDICVQSKVNMPIPRPELTPKSWLTGMLFGAAQQTYENTDNPTKRKPDRWHS